MADLLDSVGNPNNPAVLFVAYMSTADAFDDLGDAQEAINWRHKAAKEFARLSSDKQQEIGAKK